MTDVEMTRFVVTPETAARMLSEAARILHAGAVLVPRQSAYRLGDLAEAFARVGGVRIKEVGPRPGETRHEMLVASDESSQSADGDWIMVDPAGAPAESMSIMSNEAPRLTQTELDQLLRSIWH